MSTATASPPVPRSELSEQRAQFPATASESGPWQTMQKVLAPLASLKLTVALFLMAIFIVTAGTLAQVRHDIWVVIHDYFRVDFSALTLTSTFPWFNWKELFVRIDLGLFFPPSFFPPEPVFPTGLGWMAAFWPRGVPQFPDWCAVWFPKGWLIGAVMMLNLFAAHLVRFKVQAKGPRLWGGWGVIALGCLVTWMVIQSGSNPDGLQGEVLVSYSLLWNVVRFTLLALCGAAIYATVALEGDAGQRWLWGTIAAVLACATLFAANIGPGDAAMRILYQLVKATLAGLVLLAGCIMVFKKRAGIVLLHGGIALLMVYDVLVGVSHVESQMFIVEGETVNYSTDMRTSELVFAKPLGNEQEQMTVIPARMLAEGKKISDERLPVDVEVIRWLPNSEMTPPKDVTEALKEANPATTGVGLEWLVQEVRQSTGTDTKSTFDRPSAYVRLTDKKSGADLGTFLVSTLLREGVDKVATDAGEFSIALRHRRLYKDYTVTLQDIQKNVYMGTDRPKDYSSYVVIDQGGDQGSFEQRIWMNNPLRYAGETFYQSDYLSPKDLGMGNKEATVLQVVKNQGWMTPYVSCMIVLVGMLAQFGQTLLRFLSRRSRLGEAQQFADQLAATSRTTAGNGDLPLSTSPGQPGWGWMVTAAAVLIPLVIVGYKLIPPRESAGKIHYAEFGALPMWYRGRVMPIDSFARNALLQLSDRETFWDGETKYDKIPRRPAIEWLLELMADWESARKHHVVRIENLDLLNALGLERREGLCYSIDELTAPLEKSASSQENDSRTARWQKLAELAEAAKGVPPEQRNLFQRKSLELANRVMFYHGLERTLGRPPRIPPPRQPIAPDDFPALAQRLEGYLNLIGDQRKQIEEFGPPPLLVPTHIGRGDSELKQPEILKTTWETPHLVHIYDQFYDEFPRPTPPAIDRFCRMLDAARDGDPAQFNQSVAAYKQLLQQEAERDDVALAKVSFENFYNHFSGFNIASWLYVVAGCLAGIGWLAYPRVFQRASFWMLVAVLAIHTFALAGRLYISGRPPVTNLYSASVFIGWAAVIGGIIIERLTRIGFGNVVAAAAGFLTLRVASGLAADGDTFVVLEAVLDTQFWLATHVVTITLGYATTYLAGLLGLLYIVLGVFTPAMSPAVAKENSRMTYGVLCFATFFSFVGTVLGGLWADDSWGRFWGWDPKENGALIIVLWNALILHARWGGMIKERGMAVLTVLGNIVVTWSFFGVNELGVGLHSYGFTEGRLLMMALFNLSQLAVAGLGLLPQKLWLSRRTAEQAPAV